MRPSAAKLLSTRPLPLRLLLFALFLRGCLSAASLAPDFLARLGATDAIEWRDRETATQVPPFMTTMLEEEEELEGFDTVRYVYPQAAPGLRLSFNLSVSTSMTTETSPALARAVLRLRLAGCGTVSVRRTLPYANTSAAPTAVSLACFRGADAQHPLLQAKARWLEFDVTSQLDDDDDDDDEEVAAGGGQVIVIVVQLSEGVRLDADAGDVRDCVALITFTDSSGSSRRRRNAQSKTSVPPSTSALSSSTPRPPSSTSAAPASSSPRNRRRGRGRKKHRERHGNHSRHPQKDLCRRVDLLVDFKELKWDDFILYPSTPFSTAPHSSGIYNAYMCVGECPNPLPDRLNVTNHATIQSLLNSLNPDVPAPCCVATETMPLNVLYRDKDNNVVMQSYPHMRVAACGCR